MSAEPKGCADGSGVSSAAFFRDRLRAHFWFGIHDVLGLLRRPLLRTRRVTRIEWLLIKARVYTQRRGFGWTD